MAWPDDPIRPKKAPPRPHTAGEDDPAQPQFSRTLAWVAGVHGAVIALLIAAAVVHNQKKPEPVLLQLLPEGQLVRGDGGVAPHGDVESEGKAGQPKPPAPEPPTPVPPPPAPEPPAPPKPQPPPPEPAPKPVQEPVPAPEPVVKPKPEPQPAPVKTPPKPEAVAPPQPAKPAPPKEIQVSLKEVVRAPAKGAETKPAKKTEGGKSQAAPKSDSREEGNGGTGVTASEIKSRLKGRLGKAGVASATADGKSGVPGGQGKGDASAYYAVIRDRYYNIWKQPAASANKGLSTLLKIRVAKSGAVASHEIARSSGNKEMDDSVLAAAKGVSTIGVALPDILGNDYADITVEFEF